MNQQHQIYNVYRFVPEQGQHRLLGSVVLSDGRVEVLSDYFGHLAPLEDPHAGGKYWSKLNRNPYFQIVTREDLRRGERPDLLPEEQVATAFDPPDAPAKPSSCWEYSHPILGSVPQILECDSGVYKLNGAPIAHDEARVLLDYLRRGQAQIRYRRSPLEKATVNMRRMAKIESKLAGALGHLRSAVQAGHVHPDVLKALSQEIFVDPMVAGVGNKKAYNDFASRPRQGVHLFLDGNDFGSINKLHSHDHGDQAIRSMGAAMREAMDETVGRGNGKLFRYGGDEFRAHVPDQQKAAEFMRALRTKLKALPLVGGTHSLSVSAGFGHTPETAEEAANHAKKAKKAAAYPLGQAETHVHSLLPGSEGAVPVETQSVQLTPPPRLSQDMAPALTPPPEPSPQTQAVSANPAVPPKTQSPGQ